MSEASEFIGPMLAFSSLAGTDGTATAAVSAESCGLAFEFPASGGAAGEAAAGGEVEF